MRRLCLILLSINLFSARIKEIAKIEDIYDKQLVGYGLVIGLNRTGDSRSVLFTQYAVKNMLENLDLTTPDAKRTYTKNIASVMVTAIMNSLHKKGTKLDVKVGAIGDAKSLENGVLLITPLKSIDGVIFAEAQGKVVVDKDNPTTGYILDGAIVVSEIPIPIKDTITLTLIHPDFTSSVRVQEAINRRFGGVIAKAIDGGKIIISVPEQYKNKNAEFISNIEAIDIPVEVSEKVIINLSTGTIVSGMNVKISPVRLNYKNLMIGIDRETILSEFVDMLKTLGVPPKDMVHILQGLNRSGAIASEVVVE